MIRRLKSCPITRANYETRPATHLDKSMNEALSRDKEYVSESTQRRIASVGDALIAGLLFADEFNAFKPGWLTNSLHTKKR